LSPELRGGGGVSFEDAVAAVYLAALLTETSAPGLRNGRITKVVLQGAASGEPMDDVIVHTELPDESSAKLALQVKRELVISAAPTNSDFRAVILGAAETMGRDGFRPDVDQVGVVTGTVSAAAKRAFIFVCEFARGSDGFEGFRSRLFEPGFVDADRRGVFNNVATILSGAAEAEPERAAYILLRHLVLIEMDLLHRGATGDAATINTLAGALRPEAAGTAPDLWNRLKGIAREGATVAMVYTRTALLQRLGGRFRIIGAPSFRRTLNLLGEEASRAALQIPNQIGGRSYPRSAPLTEAASSDAVATFLVGLPGSGKSAVLRNLVEDSLRRGPVLFLKSDRLRGRSWWSYAADMGLDVHPIADLLVELATVGDGVVFIDGIDRVEVESRNVVLDVLTAVLETLGRSRIRVVITVRGNEFDPLQSWLPRQLLTGNGTKIVNVPAFDDAECHQILADLPALRPLLFGGDRLQEIARRPFFTAVLASSASLSSSPSRTVLSEVDLATSWWTGGGLAAEGSVRRRRQGVLLELARLGATTLGRRMPTAGLDADTLADLVADGVLREVRLGHSVTFSHDIFFEWAFLQLLIGREGDWPMTVAAVGEPPALGRIVELLSQWTLEQGESWAEHFARLEGAGMRSQWRRAWLVGPFDSPSFAEHSDIVTDLLFRGDAPLFARLVLWFQAERTRPNPIVLSGEGANADLPARQRVQFADALAWPSDFFSWRRFLTFIIETRTRQSVRTIPAVTEAFSVWQNLFRRPGLSSGLSRRICAVVDDWLSAIEAWRYADCCRRPPREWSGLSENEIKALETRLRSLLLTAGPHEVTRISAYLAKVSHNERLAHDAFDEIVTISEVLITGGHAVRLREVTVAACVEDLPQEVHDRRVAEGRNRFIGGDFSYHDWHSLSVDRLVSLSPATPAHEPFRSLFRHAPGEGRALVRGLANHAITAWRQLHHLSYDRRGTPIPARVEWPWGGAEYWGDDQTYCWPRGVWGPSPVTSGLMALEAWALEQLRDGRPVDDVIREVVEGHESNAVLSIANVLALTDARGTPSAAALVSSQRIWRWEERRFRNEFSGSANLIGFGLRGDRQKAEPVKALNDLPARKMMFSSLAMCVVLREGVAAATTRAAMERFPDDLPYDLEEERGDAELTESLRERAIHNAAFAVGENYNFERTPEGNGIQVTFNDPRANDPERQAQAQEVRRQLVLSSTAAWASNSLDRGTPLSREEYESNLDAVRPHLNQDPAISAARNELVGRGQAAVGVAAACLALGVDLTIDEISWCRDRILEAVAVPVAPSEWAEPYMIPVFHPAEYAAPGLAGLARRGEIAEGELEPLLRICAHPNDTVARKAITATAKLHDLYPRLAWAGLQLLVRRSVIPARPFDPDHPDGRPDVERSRMEAALREVLTWYREGGTNFQAYALPAPLELNEDDDHPRRRVVRRPTDAYLHHKFLGEAFEALPWETLTTDAVIGSPTLQLLELLTAWTTESMQPSDDRAPRRRSDDRRISELMLWGHQLYQVLARATLARPVQETRRRFLDPIFSLPDEACLMLLKSFVFKVSARGIMDPPKASPTALALLQACAERVSRVGELSTQDYGDRYRSRDLGPLLKDLLFVSIDDATGATRFANGDFSDLPTILPIVETIGPAATRSYVGLSAYLTLCEKSVALFPTEPFVHLVSSLLGNARAAPAEWIGTFTPGRIAALIHDLAERDSPVTVSLSQNMLAVLDALVDIGDRRSAALQASQIFREVRVG
jgi:hypothetical protein